MIRRSAKILQEAKQGLSTNNAALQPYLWSLQEKMAPSVNIQQVPEDRIKKLCALSLLYAGRQNEIPEKYKSKVAQLGKDVEKIMECLEKIQQVNTEGVEPMYSPLQFDNNCIAKARVDRVADGNILNEVLGNATEKRGKYFVVPKVLGENVE